jgi:hypothetical protein
MSPSFQQLTPKKSPISPLNPVFLPFIAFFVPKCHGFNSINVTIPGHRNFWVSQAGFSVEKVYLHRFPYAGPWGQF